MPNTYTRTPRYYTCEASSNPSTRLYRMRGGMYGRWCLVGRIISHLCWVCWSRIFYWWSLLQALPCPREANEVAHEIAWFCFASKTSYKWVNKPPSFILEKLINDVTVLWLKQQVSDVLFSLPGYQRGLKGFNEAACLFNIFIVLF
jgi:hypothetical protein